MIGRAVDQSGPLRGAPVRSGPLIGRPIGGRPISERRLPRSGVAASVSGRTWPFFLIGASFGQSAATKHLPNAKSGAPIGFLAQPPSLPGYYRVLRRFFLLWSPSWSHTSFATLFVRRLFSFPRFTVSFRRWMDGSHDTVLHQRYHLETVFVMERLFIGFFFGFWHFFWHFFFRVPGFFWGSFFFKPNRPIGGFQCNDSVKRWPSKKNDGNWSSCLMTLSLIPFLVNLIVFN